MSLATLLNMACTITPRTTQVQEGEAVPVDGEPITLDGGPDGGCYAEQRTASEGTDRANRQTDEWLVMIRPATVEFTGTALVEIPALDLALEVNGPPNRVSIPRLRSVHHIELIGRQVTG